MIRVCAAAVLVFSPALASATELPFASASEIEDLAAPRLIEQGDLDGDGDLDLVVADEDSEDTLWWIENLGGGAFGDAEIIDDAQGNWRAVVLFDYDQDGDLDVVASTNSFTESVFWFENELNDGGGWSTHGVYGTDEPWGVAVGDLDGDGAVEAVFTTGDGKLRFGPSGTIVASSLGEGRGVAVADTDNDGDLDIVVAWHSSDMIALFTNDGGAPPTFSNDGVIFTTDGATKLLDGFDFDHDGDVDFVLSGSSHGDQIGWANNGGGGVTGWTVVEGTDDLNNPGGLAAGDVDGDGDTDLFGCSGGDNQILYIENTSTDGSATSWATGVVVGGAVNTPGELNVADVDVDGDLDLLVGVGGADEAVWYENDDGVGGAWTKHLMLSQDSAELQAADLDQDGDIDGVLTGNSEIQFLENDGTNLGWTALELTYSSEDLYTFGSPPSDFPSPKDLRLLDFDRDSSIVDEFADFDGDLTPDCVDDDDDDDGSSTDGFDDTDSDGVADCFDDDDDGDGLPDVWEALHACQDLLVADADHDSDLDGRDGTAEWNDDVDSTDPCLYEGPDAPVALAPVDEVVDTLLPELVVENATSPVGDALTYTFEIYLDAELTQLHLGSFADVPEGAEGTTGAPPDENLPDNATVWWRAAAADGFTQGPWSAPAAFEVDVTGELPSGPLFLAPLDEADVDSISPTLRASTAVDPEGPDRLESD